MEKIAHIRYEDGKEATVQTLSGHTRNTAEYAAENLACVGLSDTGRLAGLLHDAGKATQRFEDYITAAAKGEKTVRGSVNHTFAGIILLFELIQPKNSVENLAAELIACAIGSHHGLFDCIDPDGKNNLLYRLEKDWYEIAYEEAKENFLHECASEEEIRSLFVSAAVEVENARQRILIIKDTCRSEHELTATEMRFLFGVMERLLQSALMDADRRDTAEFYGTKKRESNPQDAHWQVPLSALEAKLAGFAPDSPINRARSEISDLCRDAAFRSEHGIYRLNVPTGSGKTLSALRFALTHAEKYGKDHVFYIAPLLTVLEQNADVIRDAAGDPSIVLEHHSNIVKSEMEKEECDRYELLAESWDAPIVVTTMVQFLNTLFSDKTSCVRRMYALSNSVIVIDEIQSLPYKTVEIANLMLNFLAHVCKATVLLCSATQPCLEKVEHPLILSPDENLVPYRRELWEPFDRVRIVDLCEKPYSAAETAELVCERIRESDSVLLICNTKRTAYQVYALLCGMKSGETPFKLLHLSASMCQKHRRAVLEQIGKPPRAEKIVCVTTQIVEAGVDLSFGCVIRMLAGVDNVAQAAGRCNRSGEYGRICEVDLIRAATDLENLAHLDDIRAAQNAAQIVLNERQSDEAGNVDLLSDEAVSMYYRNLFRNVSTEYRVSKPDTTLYDLLSANGKLCDLRRDSRKQILCQAFKTAGENFSVFDENTTDVIVPYDDQAKDLIAGLFSERAKRDLAYARSLLAKAKPYTVTVYAGMLKRLRDESAVYGDEITVLAEGYYRDDVGLCPWTDADPGLLEF